MPKRGMFMFHKVLLIFLIMSALIIKRERHILQSIKSSAAIPVFTIADFSDIIDGKKAGETDLLTAYSHSYFNDMDSYIHNIIVMTDNKKASYIFCRTSLPNAKRI